MSVTVKSVNYDLFVWKDDRDVHTLQNDASVTIHTLRNKTEMIDYTFTFKKGFKCDGLSVPVVFRWFLTSWDKQNMLYNLAGVVHDGLYGNCGFGEFTRDESDAIFRGMLRESGMNRFHASTADWALGIGAKSHWGNDDLKCAKKVTMTKIKK